LFWGTESADGARRQTDRAIVLVDNSGVARRLKGTFAAGDAACALIPSVDCAHRPGLTSDLPSGTIFAMRFIRWRRSRVQPPALRATTGALRRCAGSAHATDYLRQIPVTSSKSSDI